MYTVPDPMTAPTLDELSSFDFETKSITVRGHELTFRELSVEENDAAADAAKQSDGTINGRTMMRMMILSSSVEPKLTDVALAKMPQKAYIKVYDTVTKLNTVELGEDPETEGKS
jgi:hypothetical protein